MTDQWKSFADFVRWETAVGGPDPHMAVVGHLSAAEPLAERVWRAGCYIGVYNVPTAQALWEAWPWPTLSVVPPDALAEWLQEHWAGLAFRRERRAVRSPEKLARFLHSYADWAEGLPARAPWFDLRRAVGSPEGRYEDAWTDCQFVYGLGRYVALKLLEFLRRYCDAPIALPDLRPRGGWSPREALALLFPDFAHALAGDDRPEHLRVANALAEETRLRLAWDHDLEVDRYNVQVLLCDYKQSWSGRRQFPGRSQDSELVYWEKVADHWQLDRSMFDARAALFPPEALGEVQGWDGVREELGHVLRDHGYTWSDLRFDYLASRDRLEDPVPRVPVAA